MMLSGPAPVGAPVPPPAAPKAPAGPPTIPGAPAPAGAPAGAPTGAPAGGAKAPAGAPPAQGQGQVDPAAAKAAVIDKLMKTTATDAIADVDASLAKIASLTVGGGTPEGTQSAKLASALLTDSSMMLQHAHMKAMEQIRTMAGELHLKLMSAASGLAFMGGQVAIAGQSKQPVKLAEIAAGPIAETKATMAEVVNALNPKAPAGEGGAPAAPAQGQGAPAAPAQGQAGAPAAPAAPAPGPQAPPAGAAPNGNTGVAGPITVQPHVQGPGTGKGPNPA